MITREAAFWFAVVVILVGATLAMLSGMART
jgi:hypothetical protein